MSERLASRYEEVNVAGLGQELPNKMNDRGR
jgi:hypothetical protein